MCSKWSEESNGLTDGVSQCSKDADVSGPSFVMSHGLRYIVMSTLSYLSLNTERLLKTFIRSYNLMEVNLITLQHTDSKDNIFKM